MKTKRFLSLVLLSAVVVSCLGISTEAAEYQGEVITCAVDATGSFNMDVPVWGDRIFEKCGIGRDEGGDGGKTPEIRGKRRLSARDGGANYQQS